MSPDAQRQHAGFRQAVRGAVVAQVAFDAYRRHEVGWAQVRESWMRLERNGKPTPWDGLVGRPSARSGSAADLLSSSVDEIERGAPESPRLGTTPINLTADLYYLSLAPGVETPLWVESGGLRWRYDGQQVFSHSAKPASGVWHRQPDERPATMDEDPEEFFGVGRATHIDEFGRRWLLDSVDMPAVRAQIARAQRVTSAVVGDEPLPLANRRIPVPSDAASNAEEHFVYPVGTWSQNTCGYFDNSDDPVASTTTPFNDRARKVVVVRNAATGQRGSGTMIDDRHILTAAHVVTDGSGNKTAVASLTVCTYGNLTSNYSRTYEIACYSVINNHTRGDWKGFGGSLDYINWDHAIITLQNVLVSPNNFGWMALSQASGDTIVKHDDVHRGYPGSSSSCGSNSFTTPVGTSGFNGNKQSDATGKPDTVMSATVNYTTSTATGMSGGPHYYCPTDDCDDGHWITGVQSGAWEIGFDGASNGPRASFFRDWAEDFRFNYL